MRNALYIGAPVNTSDLHFDYPKNLIATEKKPVSRVMVVDKGDPMEITLSHLLTQIGPDDLLVVNDTKVINARLHAENGMEVLFIEDLGNNTWNVLCPARKWPKGQNLMLPGDVELELVEMGRPQKVRANKPLSSNYFAEYGDVPLPPYIQEMRGERESRPSDWMKYQTDWAKKEGSLAAPTASLHFTKEDLEKVRRRGARVETLSLHVGLGTFLPIYADKTEDHQMHEEGVHIPNSCWMAVEQCHDRGGRVWALGSTVTRALESKAQGYFEQTTNGYFGKTDLFISPGYEFKAVDVLMTNFHQPQTTLLAMVMAFAGKETTQQCYQWAIDRKFRLFSYGDLSVWL